jgi:branched-chain amino acid transport system substrate-binding protein
MAPRYVVKYMLALPWRAPRSARRAGALAACVVLAVAGCSNSARQNAATAATSGKAIAKCGLGNNKKATGTPIKLGGIVTNQPGVDFTEITSLANAYFECVNAHGGINGRPIQYIVEQEQSSAQQVAADATKLISNDHVLAMVGSASLIDCSVNDKYYQQQGFNLVVAGVPSECFASPDIAPVNEGPYYSSLAAAQYLLDQGAKSIVAVTAQTPGASFTYSGAIALAKEKGVPASGELQSVPIDDASNLALSLVRKAGTGGGVLLNFSPPEMLKVLEAAQQENIINKVKWACVSCNDDSIAKALGSAWNGKLGVTSEFNLVDSTGPQNLLYQQVTKTYAPSQPLNLFGQMGFLAAEIVTSALLKLPASQLTVAGVNKAIQSVKDFKTDMLCQPWYFGTMVQHVPNNYARIVLPDNGTFVQHQGACLAIPALPSNPLAKIRQEEKAQGLTS